jgi:hypothetical protein
MTGHNTGIRTRLGVLALTLLLTGMSVGIARAEPPETERQARRLFESAECTSGNCRDNVCCNEACTLPCQSCGTGTCLPIEKADDIPECTGNMTCNAKGKCVARGS